MTGFASVMRIYTFTYTIKMMVNFITISHIISYLHTHVSRIEEPVKIGVCMCVWLNSFMFEWPDFLLKTFWLLFVSVCLYVCNDC